MGMGGSDPLDDLNLGGGYDPVRELGLWGFVGVSYRGGGGVDDGMDHLLRKSASLTRLTDDMLASTWSHKTSRHVLLGCHTSQSTEP